MKKLLVLSAVLTGILVPAISGWADVPRLVNYQGMLTDSSGIPVDGTHNLTFAVYSDSTGGSPLWTEVHSNVSVDEGLFNVILGGTVTLQDSLWLDGERWLGVRVDSDSEMAPRMRITSVPWAIRAAYADSAFADDGDWRIEGGNMYSNNPGYVGIGIPVPSEQLHVVGNVKVEGRLETMEFETMQFRMPPGGDDGYVLTSDIYGEGTWRPNTGGADDDWSGAGSGMMWATHLNDFVGIGSSTPSARLFVQNPGGTDAVGILCQHNHGIHVDEAINNGIEVDRSGNRGVCIIETGDDGIYVQDALDDGIEVFGVNGHGINVHLPDLMNSNNGVNSRTDGVGYAVYGRRGDAPTGGNVKMAAVGGESKTERGVAGFSDDKDGVHGQTNTAGTYSVLASITGGVHGEPMRMHPDADNFAVVGTPGDLSSTGVLGVGGQLGHGVVGIPGGLEGATTAGVRGITREGGWPPAAFPITEDMIDKGQVGVLGQADEYVAIWGESLQKVGVTGTAGNQRQLVDFPDTSGVYGYSDLAYGVTGESDVTDFRKAGVKAIGNGVSGPGAPNAAALEINDGAICVSGTNRPAGNVKFQPTWNTYNVMMRPANCDCPCHGHDHEYAQSAGYTLHNSLICPNSIILLTVESDEPMFARVTAKGLGVASIGICAVTPYPPDEVIGLNYLIINPH